MSLAIEHTPMSLFARLKHGANALRRRLERCIMSVSPSVELSRFTRFVQMQPGLNAVTEISYNSPAAQRRLPLLTKEDRLAKVLLDWQKVTGDFGAVDAFKLVYQSVATPYKNLASKNLC